jgi:DnaK suppressor protein
MSTEVTTEAVADAARARLQHDLAEREGILRDLEPRALPSVDPIAYQTAASTRLIITQIASALERLDAGTYGLCTRCGRQIAPARLEVVPHASACIDCQSHAEAA